ncbi:hypothetical protein B0J11DRAFT_161304 [Dendryphion nanum]|uniref:Copper-fist domain-containing protein n=1 Tax=Dendryphion nanum TaxID=256645 RepID=A0A9P9ECS0_9PLEO|nr:hypothetical protein B0J11DRAFT_161304 [Dendryphion nanum]
MPVIEGEKYACISCIKGHRVSGCLHNDRELHHINPKGRPVKQCEHCRGARKSKSHHAKCDCGDKKDKDKHKDKGDVKGEWLVMADDSNHIDLPTDNESGCCCHTTGKCICGNKKEPLDLKLDTGRQTLHSARAKPKLTTTQSESTLMVFANGHHRPCHRNNNTAHVSGAPYNYKHSRPQSLHGHAAFASYTQGTSNPPSDSTITRAMDTHSLSNNDFYAFLGSAQRSADNVPVAPLTANLETSDFQDPLFTSQSAVFGHDGNSPTDSPLGDALSTPQYPWYSAIAPVNRNLAFGSLSTSPSQDCLPYLENEWAIPSAGLNNPYWSAGDLPLDPTKLSSLTQPPSNPGLTTTGSSSQSEMGDPIMLGDLDLCKSAHSSPSDTGHPKAPQSAVSETLFWEDSPAFRPATSLSNDVRSIPTSVPPSTASTDAQTPEFDFTNSGYLPRASAPSRTSPSAEDPMLSYLEASFDKSLFPATDSTAADLGAIAMPCDTENDNWLSGFDLGFRAGFPMDGYL